jgi:hypothetical protein
VGIRTYLAKSVEKKLEKRFSANEARTLALERRMSMEKAAIDPPAQAYAIGESRHLIHSRDDVRFFRETLVKSVGQKGLCLEIGAYFAPIVTGKNARYFDVFDTKELQRRAELDPNPVVKAAKVPEMHYSDPDGDISVIDEIFPEVISSHCIEHQPDLISHLEKVYDLLEEGGQYLAFVPDKRYCFDYFHPPSTVGNVLEAATEKRRRHSLSCIINMYGASTHNEALRHWNGDHFDAGYFAEIPSRTQEALKLYENANGEYIDCHAWYFTPGTFAHICNVLFEMKKIRLRLEAVGDTRVNTLEFSAIFKRD